MGGANALSWSPTEDDVTVLDDGRRLDSRESVEAWLRELKPFGSWKPQPVTLPYSGPPLDLNRLLKYSRETRLTF